MVSKESIITGAMLILITYTLGLTLVTQAFPATQATKTVSSSGTIQIQTTLGIGIYSNSQCTTPLTSVTWGTVQPGENQNKICYIKNEGNTPITLFLQASNWAPSSASNCLALSWNYNNQPISPNQVVQVNLTLSVASNTVGITNFGFDITIIGT